MPHRLTAAHIAMTYSFEFIGLFFSTLAVGISEFLDATSWDRLQGTHGALFFMAIVSFILWNHFRSREKREIQRIEKAEAREEKRIKDQEEERKEERAAVERRHEEAMKLQQANLKEMSGLAAEGIKAQLIVAGSLTRLEEALAKRPCQCMEEINRQAEEDALRKLRLPPILKKR